MDQTSDQKETRKPGKNRIFLYVTILFLILISAWTFLIVTAVNNQPDVIELSE